MFITKKTFGSPHVPARRDGRRHGPAAAGCDGSGGNRPVADGGRERSDSASIYMPNGVYPDMWHPEKVGRDFEFNTIMKPLERHRDHLTTISQMKAPG
jgi:hypothetical protein